MFVDEVMDENAIDVIKNSITPSTGHS